MNSALRYCRFLLVGLLAITLGAMPTVSLANCASSAPDLQKSLHCCCGANCHCGPGCCGATKNSSRQTPSPASNPDREARDLVQSLPVVAQMAEPTSDPQEFLFFDSPLVGEPLAEQTLLGQHTCLRV